jgi:hypothetical protein
MGLLLGDIGISDSDYFYNSTNGQRVVYDASADLLSYYSKDVAASTSLFVEEETELHSERYKLPGNGYLQRRGRNGDFAAVKAGGSWDVSYPLEDKGASLGHDDVTFAYMTLKEYERYLDTIMIQHANSHRLDMLRALFNNLARPFYDEIWPNLTVQPLANGDSVSYPPVIGSTADATQNYYLATNYLPSAISEINNPISAGVQVLQTRFGTPTGGSNIATFYNQAQDSAFKGLTEFVPVQYHLTHPGVNTATVDLPGVDPRMMNGTWEVTGNCNGSVMAKWAFIPANYMLQIHLRAAPPLKRRVDPAKVGIARGLHLWADDLDMPFRKVAWRDRYGYGVGNRLSAVLTYIGTGTTYVIPSPFV